MASCVEMPKSLNELAIAGSTLVVVPGLAESWPACAANAKMATAIKNKVIFLISILAGNQLNISAYKITQKKAIKTTTRNNLDGGLSLVVIILGSIYRPEISRTGSTR